MQPKVYIVILNYKNWHDVVDCLSSVFRLHYDNYQVFVIDNNSGNGSLEHLMEWADAEPNEKPYSYFSSSNINGKLDLSTLTGLTFVQNEENNGFAGGNNLVLQLLSGKDAYVWLLNPDMVVETNTLAELVAFANTQPFRSIIGTVNRFYFDKNKVHLYGGARINFNSATISLTSTEKDIPDLDYITGGSMFVHASHFTELGLLPEEYFLYWEETDWCYRAKQKGFKMLVCKTAVCYDKISATIGKSFLADYYYTRNGLIFISKYRKQKMPFVLFSAFLRLANRLVTGQWERSKGVYKGILGYLKWRPDESQ
jgi:GT2 family glycosyltransferase